MELSQAQEIYKTYISDANHPKLGAFVALVEEIGELAEEILNREIYDYSNSSVRISEEIADVFICILEICDIYDINLEEVFVSKFEKVSKKAQTEWKDNLTKVLTAKRMKMDNID